LAAGGASPLLPDVPTLKEAKAGDVNVDMWYGVFAPAGMPADQVDALNREIRAILASEEVRHAFAPQGMDPAGSTPAEFKALVQGRPALGRSGQGAGITAE
jgi:tripartite-type tricarboxylate transporter receptor subunit TctC